MHLDVHRYNNLLKIIKTELGKVKKAILGLTLFDEKAEQTYNHIILNNIPDHWEEISGIKSSCDTLSAFFTDLLSRLNHIKQWIYEQQPIVFWLPMFANQKAFLAALLQNFARQTNNHVDNYEIRFTFSTVEPTDRAPKGEWINGLVIEHAMLNPDTFEIQDIIDSTR